MKITNRKNSPLKLYIFGKITVYMYLQYQPVLRRSMICFCVHFNSCCFSIYQQTYCVYVFPLLIDKEYVHSTIYACSQHCKKS
jgi:hypothetical protein